MQINSFSGKYRFLSNFWYSALKYEDKYYPTVEHAFQAAKTTVEEFREAIRVCDTPGDAKAMGKRVTLRSDWEDVKIGIMRELLRQKFTHYTDLGYQLRCTGDAELIEGNTWNDTFWGVCNDQGQNWLGKLLMEIRSELRVAAIPVSGFVAEEPHV